LCAWNVTNGGRNGMRGLQGPPFHDVSCTLVRHRDRTRNCDTTTDQVDTVMYPSSDPTRYKFIKFLTGKRKWYKFVPPIFMIYPSSHGEFFGQIFLKTRMHR
jgi:hypothetical protein